MANERVPWRHRKQALGGAVLYAEQQISGRWLFGVFYDDGDFEELDVDGLANRGPPTPYVVYEGFQDRHRVISHLPHPNLASIADAVDVPALARAALAADPALPGVVDRQRAGRRCGPGAWVGRTCNACPSTRQTLVVCTCGRRGYCLRKIRRRRRRDK